MTLIHPLQNILTSRDGSLVFAIVKNCIISFKYQSSNHWDFVGQWSDNFDKAQDVKVNVAKEQQRQISENENKNKKLKSNKGDSITKAEAKIPSPGIGAPPIYSYIRNLKLTPDESKLIACADSDKSVLIFDVDKTSKSNVLKLTKRFSFPKRPNAISIADDGATIIVADKFGDVYSIGIDSNPKEKFTQEPILGHVSMLTDVHMIKDSDGRQFIITCDRDEHIKISHYPQCYIVDKWLFGHKHFVSSICCDENNMLLSAGGDDRIFSWDWKTGVNLSSFEYSDLIKPYLNDQHLAPSRFQNEENNLIEFAVSKIVKLSGLPFVAFFVEATKCIIILEISRKDKGKLSLKQVITLPYNVISLSTQNNELQVTLDNQKSPNIQNNFAKFIQYDSSDNKFVVNDKKSTKFDDAIRQSIQGDSNLDAEKEDIYPLYNISSLRKHGEHYS
ncbi:trm82p [Saccharomyces arboricola H-6]|uniref:Trm82p n=1 Tax=Saccharomyces arboricola (strain H-6 / AS 2.3317 / CBS 10644) TaxID=1160507 RepID=J8PYA0_SACAR|nr:trm82p [Saccharomyces arboricola H-6]